jgi:hypothetical protein
MGISVSQQLKILCSATARAFLAQDEAVVAEIDRKALEFENELENLSKRNSEDASLQSAGKIESRAPGLEYLMARVLESSHGAWPISRAASSFSGGDNSGAIQLPEQSSDLNEVVTSAI